MERTKSNDKTRFIKVIKFNSVNEIDNVENTVNAEIEKLRKAGAKVVSVQINNFGISPINLMYNIIYEADTPVM